MKHDDHPESTLTMDLLMWTILQLKDRPMAARPGTRIIHYTDAELADAIADAKREIGDDAFYSILKGIDAYFEQRRRKWPSDYPNSPHRPGSTELSTQKD